MKTKSRLMGSAQLRLAMQALERAEGHLKAAYVYLPVGDPRLENIPDIAIRFQDVKGALEFSAEPRPHCPDCEPGHDHDHDDEDDE